MGLSELHIFLGRGSSTYYCVSLTIFIYEMQMDEDSWIKFAWRNGTSEEK
jgi:hypothetical protein